MVERYTYIKPRIGFSKDGFKDNVTGEVYDFTVDTVLDLLNDLHNKYRRQEALARQRRNEIISRVDFFNDCLKKEDSIPMSVKDFLAPLTSIPFDVENYVKVSDVLNVIDDYVGVDDDVDSELLYDIRKKISHLK